MLISDKLKLSNVHYIPTLTRNLIYVLQSIDECNCIVQFSNKFCDTEICSLEMLISTSEVRNMKGSIISEE